MRYDNENHKYANWRVNYLFANYLFGKNFTIMANIELMFVSLIAICQNATDPLRERNERENEHRAKALTLFSSVVDVYDVIFRSFTRGLSDYVASHKKLNADTIKNYLKMIKLAAFFEQSGKKTLVSTGSKRRGDDINFKFLKMLLGRSEQFVEFVKFVHKKEIDEHLDVVEFQFIAILSQMMAEAEERRKRAEEQSQEVEAPQLKEVSQEDEDKLPSRGTMPPKMMSEQRGRADSEAIMFEQDDEEEGFATLSLQKRPSAVDDKTKKYLALVKRFQYEDEYDDTHDVGDGRANNKRGRGGNRGRTGGRRKRSDDSDYEEDEIEKGSAFPVEQENEDSGEEFDPMNKWERTQSNRQDNEEEGGLQRNTFRGGRGQNASRGDRTRGGQKIDGKREKHNQSKYGGNRREDNHHQNGGYHQRRDDNYRPGGQDHRDDYRMRDQDQREDYKPRGNDRGNYKLRENDSRNDYKEGSDRGQQGQYKPKQGNRDTR